MRPVLPNSSYLFSTFPLEYSSVLSRFCIYNPSQDLNRIAMLWDWRSNVINTTSMCRAQLVYEQDIKGYRLPRNTILVTRLIPDEGGSESCRFFIGVRVISNNVLVHTLSYNDEISSCKECKIQKNWCSDTVAPTKEHHDGHSSPPANQRWDQVPGTIIQNVSKCNAFEELSFSKLFHY